MSTLRLTQGMLVSRAQTAVQLGLSRFSAAQQQVSTGKRINRPSDSPPDTATAMRLRASLKAVDQYARNASDGTARLGLVDQTLTGVYAAVSRARDIALQGSGSTGGSSREALATEVDQIRDDLLSQANTTYLTRPVFGGTTAGGKAYDSTGTFVGVAGAIPRQVGDDVKVRVDVDGRTVFGDGSTSVFAELDALSTALRTNDGVGLTAGLDALAARLNAVSTAQASVGASAKRIEQAEASLIDRQLSLTSSLSDLEDVDLARATVDLNLQQVAYQAALAATARVMQPSLLDFLR